VNLPGAVRALWQRGARGRARHITLQQAEMVKSAARSRVILSTTKATKPCSSSSDP
jgi:hypothetical protein